MISKLVVLEYIKNVSEYKNDRKNEIQLLEDIYNCNTPSKLSEILIDSNYLKEDDIGILTCTFLNLSEDLASKVDTGIAIAGLLPIGALIGTILYSSVKLYKSFLSKAARSCKGAPDKKECIKRYKEQGMVKQIKKIQGNMSKCKKTNNPEKCKEKLEKHIRKIRVKLGDYT